MKVIFCYLLVLFSYFLYDTDILRLSTVIQKNSLLKLTAANQNPDAGNDPILDHRIQLELLYGNIGKVTRILDRRRELWKANCEGLDLSPSLEDWCKRLLAHLREIMNYQEDLRRRISDREERIAILQAANN